MFSAVEYFQHCLGDTIITVKDINPLEDVQYCVGIPSGTVEEDVQDYGRCSVL